MDVGVRELKDDRPAIVAAVVCSIAAAAAAAVVVPAVVTAELDGRFTWYAARSAGMVAYLLATASVVFGIATSSRFGARLLRKGNLADVHRALSLMMVLAISAHLLFLALDSYAGFTVAELFVPFVTWYRPVWTGLGIIAAYLACAVYVSFYLRQQIGYRAWRAFHYLSFAVFALGTLHGLFAGTDSGTTWSLAIYGSSVACVFAMLLYRIISARADKTRRAAPSAQGVQSMNERSRARAAIAEPLGVGAGLVLREGE